MRGYPQFAQALDVAWDPLAGADEIAGLPPCTMERGALSIPLPAPGKPTVPLDVALAERRSIRRYADREVPAADLSAMLASAVRAAPLLGWAVVSRDVQGLATGSHHVEVTPDGGLRLHRVGPVPGAEAWPQHEFHLAPVVVVAMANLLVPADQSAAPLYQLAGRAAYAAGMAAATAGLGSCLFYGPTLAARGSLRFDNVTRAPLIGLSAGLTGESDQ
ncbi:hypothetical protein G6W61_16570 [Streptomyces sp. KAI-26]|uniref:nitroreductase family protein n=1 Tax=Streptomyces sp. KAI-26 TaxID=1169747 RepID=UPI001587E2C6|nr:nitroreductase family protein [Streptomyces sp. KAI-26]NUV87810.1 hypothetical protein [Streptomyces sp. KAI-26]NUW20258.1 hypothetical protein [Streptomyces roseoviolaceus]